MQLVQDFHVPVLSIMNVAKPIVYVTQPPYSYIISNQFVHIYTILKTVSNFKYYTTASTTQSIHLTLRRGNLLSLYYRYTKERKVSSSCFFEKKGCHCSYMILGY